MILNKKRKRDDKEESDNLNDLHKVILIIVIY